MNDVIKIPSFIIFGLFLMLILIGMCAKEEPLPEVHWSSNWQEEWLKPERLQPANTGTSNSFPSRRTYKTSYDYEIDDENAWDDFIEDIEMRGLEYTDPDAVEIWELEYK